MYKNMQHPPPVNFRFITEIPSKPGFCKPIHSAFYADKDLKIVSFYKPILFIV